MMGFEEYCFLRRQKERRNWENQEYYLAVGSYIAIIIRKLIATLLLFEFWDVGCEIMSSSELIELCNIGFEFLLIVILDMSESWHFYYVLLHAQYDIFCIYKFKSFIFLFFNFVILLY